MSFQCLHWLQTLGSGKQCCSQPKILEGAKMFDFRRMALFCLGYRLSKHKMTIYAKNFGWAWPLGPRGYTYAGKASFGAKVV